MQTILMSNNFSAYCMYLSLDTCIAPTLSRIYAYNTIYLPGLVTVKFLEVLTRYKTCSKVSAASGQ